jgi:hypothetical protein
MVLPSLLFSQVRRRFGCARLGGFSINSSRVRSCFF